MTTLSPRPSYSRMADIPSDVLLRLNQGLEETRTLAEGLAIDFATLLSTTFANIKGVRECFQEKMGILQRMRRSAELILGHYDYDHALSICLNHPSDTIRGIGAYIIACNAQMGLNDSLEASRPFAADSHFGVREWAWLAARPKVVETPLEAIKLLENWVQSNDLKIRRFAVEITRPRGVWCSHISQLKENPRAGLILLDPLRNEEEKYVQDSVANWLNDAGKSQPDWVRQVCTSWLKNPSQATVRICKKAQRNL